MLIKILIPKTYSLRGYHWKHFLRELWHHLLVTAAPWRAFDGQKRQYNWLLFNSRSVYAWLAIDPITSVYAKTADTARMHWYGTRDTATYYITIIMCNMHSKTCGYILWLWY